MIPSTAATVGENLSSRKGCFGGMVASFYHQVYPRMENRKIWRRVALAWAALGVALFLGGCMTEKTMAYAFPKPSHDSPSLRVRQCFMDAKGHLVVLAEGGVWQKDTENTPRQPLWFGVDIPALAPHAVDGTVILPQAILLPGTPDLTALKEHGFVETPFFEYGRNLSQPLANATPTPGVAAVQVLYNDDFATPNFPEKLGRSPTFLLVGNPNLPPVSMEIEDVYTENHELVGLALLPLAVASDTVFGAVHDGALGAWIVGLITDPDPRDHANNYNGQPIYSLPK
jgi:hypothetical protein